jgi:hypothetical protein
MDEMCNYPDQMIYYYMHPFVFWIFLMSIFLLLLTTYDYYYYQLHLMTLQEKLDDLDLELGLIRDTPLEEIRHE